VHAAPGSRVETMGQVDAGRIAVPDVVLQVDRALGRLDQRSALEEGIAAGVEHAHAAQALAEPLRCGELAERGRGARREMLFGRERRRLGRQARAAREQGEQGDDPGAARATQAQGSILRARVA